MGDRPAAERACKDPNPIIDGRKANVNLAILGAKPRGNLQTSKFYHFDIFLIKRVLLILSIAMYLIISKVVITTLYANFSKLYDLYELFYFVDNEHIRLLFLILITADL